jgi:hypothetical protein
MKSNQSLKLALATALITTLIGSATAATISVSWKEFAGAINDVLDGYGVEPANNWHNLQSSVIANPTMSDGAASAITINSNVAGGYETFFGGGPLDNTPMRAGLAAYTTAPNPTSIFLTDMSSTFSEYDVIVYVTGFNGAAGGNIASVTDGSSTYYYTVPNPYVSTLIQSTDIDQGDGADEANYVRFNGLTADSATIDMRALNGGGNAIGGIQIVGTLVPEPTTALLTLAGMLIAIRRR